MNSIKVFFQTNIFISLAAVLLTLETAIQLGMKPEWHPYLLLIFFAVLFEYNLHRLLSVLTSQEVLKLEKHRWIGENREKIYFQIFISGVGFFTSAFFVNNEVILIFVPISLLTLLYSILVFGNEKHVSGLRKIPFLKNFLISVVWSAATVLLPVIQSNEITLGFGAFLIFLERFFFIFALSIPFDIRDMEADKRSGLKTVPIILGTQKALNISYLSLATFFTISFFHYSVRQEWFFVAAFGISAITTSLFIRLKTFRNMNWYYNGILDGTLILQAILVIGFYFTTHN